MPTSLTALNILLLLLPGFLSDRITDNLTPPKKRSDAVRVIDSLVFAFVDYVFYGVGSVWLKVPASPVQLPANGPISLRVQDAQGLALLLGISVLVAILWSGVSNSGKLYSVLNRLRLTAMTGRTDVWHDIFLNYRGYWFQIRLKDGTVITGWPEFYSDDPERREIFLRDAIVEAPDGSDYEVKGPGVLLTEKIEIERIEILPKEK